MRIFCSRESLTPVAAPNVSPKAFISRGEDTQKRFRIRLLKDVAWEPSVEIGATVPGYSGGLVAAW